MKITRTITLEDTLKKNLMLGKSKNGNVYAMVKGFKTKEGQWISQSYDEDFIQILLSLGLEIYEKKDKKEDTSTDKK